MVREGTARIAKGRPELPLEQLRSTYWLCLRRVRRWQDRASRRLSVSSTSAIQQNIFNFGGISNPPTVYTPTIYGGNIANISPSLANGAPLTPAGGILSPDVTVKFPQPTATTSASNGNCLTSWSSILATSETPAGTRCTSRNWSSCRSGTPPAPQFFPRSTTCRQQFFPTGLQLHQLHQVWSQQCLQRPAGQVDPQIQRQAYGQYRTTPGPKAIDLDDQ